MHEPETMINETTITTTRSDRFILMTLPGFYLAVLVATVLDAVMGQSLLAPWSLLLVLTGAFLILRFSQAFFQLRSTTAWLWQVARCSALAGAIGLLIGLAIMLLGNGSFETMTRGLSLSAFSVLYGVLIALPAGCAVILLERDATSS